MVVELRAKLLVGLAGGDEFIGLMKRLIADFPIGGFEGSSLGLRPTPAGRLPE